MRFGNSDYSMVTKGPGSESGGLTRRYLCMKPAYFGRFHDAHSLDGIFNRTQECTLHLVQRNQAEMPGALMRGSNSLSQPVRW
jgi:hypothetical protein